MQPLNKSIFIVLPNFSVHGGIRVILEWANRLAEKHRVYLHPISKTSVCNWFPISPKVNIVLDDRDRSRCDLLIVTSPHSVGFLDYLFPKRKVVFLQMMEHLFQPMNINWRQQCLRTYHTSYPLITISKWGEQALRDLGRKSPIYYVGNGVNLDHFPISTKPKDGSTVLVEGWTVGNPTKDTERLGPQVAALLREQGYRILAYSTGPLTGPYSIVPHEYYCCPSVQQLNEIYERATILIKASKQDFRACAPMEAMTKGTVTARAIQQGDDDLTHEENCLRCAYNWNALWNASTELLQNDLLRERLAENCRAYVQQYSWDYWMEKIEALLWNV